LITVCQLALGGLLFGCATPHQGPPRPNIVVIIADDLGWADVGYHGSSIQTPHLDRLASEGLKLEHFYSAPTCTPTRVGLMTGRYPSRFGVEAPAYGRIFDDHTRTLPKALKEVGYRTAISGKWHMGSPPDFTPMRYGFDSSYGYFHGQIDPYTHHYKTGVPSWHRNDEYLEEEGHATDLITAEAVRLIREGGDPPLFLYVAYSVPHHPLKEPAEWTGLYPDLESESRRWYAASVSHMDHGIGQILQAIRETGAEEDTLVLFMSDNGAQESWHSREEYQGAYWELPHDVLGDNRPLRGWKGDLHEGGIRVPAILRYPRRLGRGTVDQPISFVDWMPTFCGLVGAAGQDDWDGLDLWEVIAGSKPVREREMYWKTPEEMAVRQGPWKLIVSRRSEAAPQLFQLQKDPYEKVDLFAEEGEKAEALERRLQQISKGDIDRSK
jgi:arylsulfatase A-like enzyme